MEKEVMLPRALLGMQRALLGAVVPALRAVKVDIDCENRILFYFFFYDGEVTDQLFDLASVASAEASVLLSEYFIEQEIKRLDFPTPIPNEGTYAYLRKE